jgi:hypothetical protein
MSGGVIGSALVNISNNLGANPCLMRSIASSNKSGCRGITRNEASKRRLP